MGRKGKIKRTIENRISVWSWYKLHPRFSRDVQVKTLPLCVLYWLSEAKVMVLREWGSYRISRQKTSYKNKRRTWSFDKISQVSEHRSERERFQQRMETLRTCFKPFQNAGRSREGGKLQPCEERLIKDQYRITKAVLNHWMSGLKKAR